MRAPSIDPISRRQVDELDSPTILPPLDQPFESILASRNRLRRSIGQDPLTRRLLPAASSLPVRRTRQGRVSPSRKPVDDNGQSAQLIRMEILSCDGGSLDFDDCGRHNAENLLVDNLLVYCTAKMENVNILLRGSGARPFTLTRAVIKAPQRNFTSPVKDGLIFVRMDRIEAADTKMYDRQDPDSSDSSECAGENESDQDRLLQGQELPTTTLLYDEPGAQGGILRPQAYFSIDERVGSATIEFDPPLSARYVFIKLLSGQPFDSYPGRLEHENIDIQAILLYGYGRRSFPSTSMR